MIYSGKRKDCNLVRADMTNHVHKLEPRRNRKAPFTEVKGKLKGGALTPRSSVESQSTSYRAFVTHRPS